MPTPLKAVRRFRTIGFLEGISTVALMGIAMPPKYLAGIPEAVRITGSVHGLLFVMYVIALGLAASERLWSLPKIALYFVAAVVPFGPFVAERWLRRECDDAESNAAQ
jgi:integral membrane protein